MTIYEIAYEGPKFEMQLHTFRELDNLFLRNMNPIKIPTGLLLPK